MAKNTQPLILSQTLVSKHSDRKHFYFSARLMQDDKQTRLYNPVKFQIKIHND